MEHEGLQLVRGYLPIIPELWQEKPFRKLRGRPLHISNYKPINNDAYQLDLVRLAQNHLIRVFGNKWDQADIPAHGVSYWQANRIIAKAFSCYGLMYPYQRGTTLSGRMWQAPLNGCFVITEVGTNRFQLSRLDRGRKLWTGHLVGCGIHPFLLGSAGAGNEILASANSNDCQGPGLDIDADILAIQSAELRKEIFRHHLNFLIRQWWSRILQFLTPPLIACPLRRHQKRMASLLRHLRGR